MLLKWTQSNIVNQNEYCPDNGKRKCRHIRDVLAETEFNEDYKDFGRRTNPNKVWLNYWSVVHKLEEQTNDAKPV